MKEKKYFQSCMLKMDQYGVSKRSQRQKREFDSQLEEEELLASWSAYN